MFFGDKAKSEAEYVADGYPRKIAAYMAANPPPPFQVWACNWRAFDLFAFLVTQWRIEMGGPSGLIYQEAYLRMDELGIEDREDRLALISALRVMEGEVLKAFAEKKR